VVIFIPPASSAARGEGRAEGGDRRCSAWAGEIDPFRAALRAFQGTEALVHERTDAVAPWSATRVGWMSLLSAVTITNGT
jgi:hypothetical protein